MTDEEIKQFLSGASTGQSKSSGSMSDEEVRQFLTQSSQPDSQEPSFNLEDISKPSEKSGVSLMDRLLLSFGDERGKIDYLKKKFKNVDILDDGKIYVGNDQREMMPVDPAGFDNDLLGDLADWAGEFPVLVGQIIGSGAGATAGAAAGGIGAVPGTIAGGAAGAGAGEAVKKGIASALGVNQQKAEEMAADVMLSSALGAAGEGLGIIFKAGAGKIMSNRAKALLDKGIQRLPSQTSSKTIGMMAKGANLISGLDEDAVITAANNGFNETLKPRFINKATISEIADNLVSKSKAKEELLQDTIGSEIDSFARAAGDRKIIDSKAIYNQVINDLKDYGMIVDERYFNQNAPKEGVDYFKRLLRSLGGQDRFSEKIPKLAKFGEEFGGVRRSRIIPPTEKISANDARSIKNLFSGKEYEGLNKQLQRIAQRALNGSEDGSLKGLRHQIEEYAQSIGHQGYIDANRALSKFKGIKDILRKNGLDIEDAISSESYLKNIDSKPIGIIGTGSPLHELDRDLGKVFLDDAFKWNAAQKFSNANPNLLRLSMITGLLGAGFGGGSTEERLQRGALGLAIGTPAGLRGILKLSERALSGVPKAGRAIQKGVQRTGARIPAERTGRALISRLLDQR